MGLEEKQKLSTIQVIGQELKGKQKLKTMMSLKNLDFNAASA